MDFWEYCLYPSSALGVVAEAQLRSWETSRKETEALLIEARAIYKRTQDLDDRDLASEAELDRARAGFESLAAQLERKQADVLVAEKQLDVYRQQLEDTIIRAPFSGVVVIVISVLSESLLLAFTGGLIGAGLAWLAFDDFRAATFNWSSLRAITFAFDVNVKLLAQGIIFAMVIGLIGGLFPAIRAARQPIAHALREL